MTVPADPLREGMALGDVASDIVRVAGSVVFDVEGVLGVIVGSLVSSSGVFWRVGYDDGDSSHVRDVWLCEGDAPSGAVALSGDFEVGMRSSVSVLGCLCGVSDLSSDGDEADVIEMLDEALSSGDISVSDVVILGAAVTVGLVSDTALADAVSRSSDGDVALHDCVLICERLLRFGADISWGSSFLGAVLRGDVSLSLVGVFLSACEEGLLSQSMLNGYAADVEVGSASWDNLCVVVRGRFEMCRLGR